MPIIVGAPRSGTTLLRFMLDSHPDLAIPPETGFLLLAHQLKGRGDVLRERFYNAITTFPPEATAWNDFGIPPETFRARLAELRPFTVRDGFRLFYRMYAERFGKHRWGDKTPMFCRHLRYLQHVLPESHFIHIIRDGRDVALSLRQRWFSPGNDIRGLAAFWRDDVLSGRKQGALCRKYLEVRFEELLVTPESVLKDLCRFLDLAYDPAMVRYYERTPKRLEEHLGRYRADGTAILTHEERLQQQALTRFPPDRSRAGVWRTDLSLEERQQFELIAGPVLRELGYETGG